MRIIINRLVVFLFLAHGALYYLFPEDIYNEESNLKLLKYVLFIFFIIINFRYIKHKDVLTFITILLGCFVFFSIAHNPSIIMMPASVKKFMLYTFPLLIICITPIIDKIKLNKIVLFTTAIAVVGAFYEYYIAPGLFSRFDFTNSGGFIRVVSIFVSPNNSGLLLSLSLIFIYENKNIRKFFKWILYAAIIVSIYFTGSKTPILIIFLYITFKIFHSIFFAKVLNFKYIFLALISLIFGTLYFLDVIKINTDRGDSKTRTYDSQTAEIRYNQLFDYLGKTSRNFLAPDYNDASVTYDIAYLQFWSDFGLLGLIVFIAIVLPFIYRYRIRRSRVEVKMVLITLIVCGFSLSIFTIWPTAYIFWYLVFTKRFYKAEKKGSLTLREAKL